MDRAINITNGGCASALRLRRDMSYYPLLNAPGCFGQTVLYNFAPNNWEQPKERKRLINLTWIDKAKWRSQVIDELDAGCCKTITAADIAHYQSENSMPLLSLSDGPLPSITDSLPPSLSVTHTPSWRATLSLTSGTTSTCYQGELDPFPVPGSLLTFSPFLQFGADIENFLLFLNLEKNPVLRSASIEIFDCAKPAIQKASFEVLNNSVNIIPLDKVGIGPNELPVIICKGMSGIPLYFSKTLDGAYLSLEHTHPPASYVIHGQRWSAQKMIKNAWFKKLGNK